MNEQINKRVKQITKLQVELIRIHIRALRQEQNFIIRLNVNQHLKRGEDSDEKTLGSYAKSTIAIKKKKGQPTDHVYLEDTKKWHKDFALFFGAKSFEIGAPQNLYSVYIVKRYGRLVYGLSKTSLELLKLRLKPILETMLRNEQSKKA